MIPYETHAYWCFAEPTAEGGEDGERGDGGALDHRLGRLAVRWGEQHLRDLPWRRLRDPWAVLVVEVMAQQTQLERVIPRWTGFLDRWPSPDALADAALDEFLVFGKGLGYPRRRNLWLASRVITQEGFPLDCGRVAAVARVGPTRPLPSRVLPSSPTWRSWTPTSAGYSLAWREGSCGLRRCDSWLKAWSFPGPNGRTIPCTIRHRLDHLPASQSSLPILPAHGVLRMVNLREGRPLIQPPGRPPCRGVSRGSRVPFVS